MTILGHFFLFLGKRPPSEPGVAGGGRGQGISNVPRIAFAGCDLIRRYIFCLSQKALSGLGRAIRPSQGSRGGVAVVAAAALFYFILFCTLKSKDIAAGAQTASPPLLRELCWDFNRPPVPRKGPAESWSCQCFLLDAAKGVCVCLECARRGGGVKGGRRGKAN